MRTNGSSLSSELVGKLNGSAPAHVNLAALGGGSLGNGGIDSSRSAHLMDPCRSSGTPMCQGSVRSFNGRSTSGAASVHGGQRGASSGAESSSMLPSMGPGDGTLPGGAKRSVNHECMSGMDMVGELFQHQAKRLEAQLYQQLRDQAEIESIQSQLGATSQQLKRLQVQNYELRRLAEASDMTIRSTYSHARSVQQALNGLLHVCESLAEDAAVLRRTLREELPERAAEFEEKPRPRLPQRAPQLPPLEQLLPGPVTEETQATSASHVGTALAMLSAVASDKADTSSAQPDHNGDTGGSDAGSNDQDSNQGSGGSNQGSSNTGTEDTVLVNSNGDSNGTSKESLDEPDSGDGNGSSHGSDSGYGNTHTHSNGGSGFSGSSGGGLVAKRGVKRRSNGDSDSTGTDSLPLGVDSNSPSPPHEVDEHPPGGAKRKR